MGWAQVGVDTNVCGSKKKPLVEPVGSESIVRKDVTIGCNISSPFEAKRHFRLPPEQVVTT